MTTTCFGFSYRAIFKLDTLYTLYCIQFTMLIVCNTFRAQPVDGCIRGTETCCC